MKPQIYIKHLQPTKLIQCPNFPIIQHNIKFAYFRVQQLWRFRQTETLLFDHLEIKKLMEARVNRSLSPLLANSPIKRKTLVNRPSHRMRTLTGQLSPLPIRRGERSQTMARKTAIAYPCLKKYNQNVDPAQYLSRNGSKKQLQLKESNTPTFIRNKKNKTIVIADQTLQNCESILKQTKLQDFQLGQMLGKGANASVHVVRHRETGCFFGLKKIEKSKLQSNLNKFIASLKLHIFADDPNIAKVYDVFPHQQDLYVVMELCVDGDLTHRLKSLRKDTAGLKQMIKGIVKGLRYLHSHKILHRDLKLENILLCHDMPKITDFDLAVYQQNPLESRKTFCGSPAYFSPEMLTKTSYNSKVDIWCLGILCYELVCGYFPFEVKNYSEIENIVSQPVKEFPPYVDEGLRDFILMELRKDPQERAGWKEILTHKIFQ